ISRLFSTFRVKAVKANKARRSHRILKDALLDLLEERQLLATFTYNGGTGLLAIETDQNNEAFTILSSSNNGNYTIISSFNFSGTDIIGLTGNTTDTLTVGSDIANLTSILITNNAANSGSSLSFGLSTGNFVDNLTVNFTNSTSGTINVANSAGFINGANLSLTTTGNAITVSSRISANSSGSVTLNSRNIQVTGNITTISGSIALYGNGAGAYQSGSFHGVSIIGPNVNVTSTSGNIQVNGRGAGGSANYGINLDQAWVETGSSGFVNLTGVSGNGTDNAYGIFANYSNLRTSNGALNVSGTSNGTGANSTGLYLKTSTFSSANTSTFTITGSAANGTTNDTGIFANSSNIT
ncbi:MAG: hypothetical protein ACKO85_00045, partial [Isosphaeraceae bacterium]